LSEEHLRGNLDFNVTEEAVRSLFESHGAVNSARIMTDRDTGRSRGFAFVEMQNESEADQAIAALNGYTLEGRALNVNEARPKPDRASAAAAVAAVPVAAVDVRVVAAVAEIVPAADAASLAGRGRACPARVGHAP